MKKYYLINLKTNQIIEESNTLSGLIGKKGSIFRNDGYSFNNLTHEINWSKRYNFEKKRVEYLLNCSIWSPTRKKNKSYMFGIDAVKAGER